LAVNRAWREFAVANGAPASAEMVGSSYVAACEGALQGDPADAGLAMRFLTQLRAVLAGELEAFELEYPCHSPQRQRWFLARVSRIEGSSPLRVVVAHDDVTNLMQAQQAARDREVALRDSEQTYRTLFETVPQGIVYQDLQGRITAANPAAQRILGLSLNQMQGLDSMDPRWKAMQEDGSEFPGEKHPAMVALRTGQPVHDVLMGVQVPERGQAWLLVNAVPLLKQGALDRVYASFEDITQRVLLGREVERQARTDELTGVASRRSILARLNAEFERLHRHPDRRCALLALDLDHFKLVNDRHGHAAGDAVLVHVVAVALKTVRAVDALGRTGGEEFLIVAPDTSLEEAGHLAERLRQQVAESPASLGAASVAVTLSIGVSVIAPGDASAETALARADRALYSAKALGRDRVCVASLER